MSKQLLLLLLLITLGLATWEDGIPRLAEEEGEVHVRVSCDGTPRPP